MFEIFQYSRVQQLPPQNSVAVYCILTRITNSASPSQTQPGTQWNHMALGIFFIFPSISYISKSCYIILLMLTLRFVWPYTYCHIQKPHNKEIFNPNIHIHSYNIGTCMYKDHKKTTKITISIPNLYI